MADELDWDLFSRVMHHWPSIMEFIPLETIIQYKYYMVSHTSNTVFMRRYLAAIALRAKIFIFPAGTVSDPERFNLVKPLGRLIDIDEILPVSKPELAALIAPKLPRWIRYGDLVQFEDNISVYDYLQTRKTNTFAWTGNNLMSLCKDSYYNNLFLNIEYFPSVLWFSNYVKVDYVLMRYAAYKRLQKIHIEDQLYLYHLQSNTSGYCLFVLIQEEPLSGDMSECQRELLETFEYGYAPYKPNTRMVSLRTHVNFMRPDLWPKFQKHGVTLDNFLGAV